MLLDHRNQGEDLVSRSKEQEPKPRQQCNTHQVLMGRLDTQYKRDCDEDSKCWDEEESCEFGSDEETKGNPGIAKIWTLYLTHGSAMDDISCESDIDKAASQARR